MLPSERRQSLQKRKRGSFQRGLCYTKEGSPPRSNPHYIPIARLYTQKSDSIAQHCDSLLPCCDYCCVLAFVVCSRQSESTRDKDRIESTFNSLLPPENTSSGVCCLTINSKTTYLPPQHKSHVSTSCFLCNCGCCCYIDAQLCTVIRTRSGCRRPCLSR